MPENQKRKSAVQTVAEQPYRNPLLDQEGVQQWSLYAASAKAQVSTQSQMVRSRHPGQVGKTSCLSNSISLVQHSLEYNPKWLTTSPVFIVLSPLRIFFDSPITAREVPEKKPFERVEFAGPHSRGDRPERRGRVQFLSITDIGETKDTTVA